MLLEDSLQVQEHKNPTDLTAILLYSTIEASGWEPIHGSYLLVEGRGYNLSGFKSSGI